MCSALFGAVHIICEHLENDRQVSYTEHRDTPLIPRLNNSLEPCIMNSILLLENVQLLMWEA